jgi:V8-like Glu-specific endopeptidase
MPAKKQKKSLNEFTPEEILAELRQREGGRVAAAKRKSASPLVQADSASLVKALKDAQKLVYGVDDRKDIFQVTDPAVLARADSTVSLIDVSRITDNGDGTSTILTTTFGESHDLCEGERFRNQPTAARCSGFLVAPDLIATAGHCVNANNLARNRFVFGFRMINETEARVIIPNDQIFKGVAILTREEVSTGADYAVVRLDRPATGRTILKIRRNGKIDDGQPVYVIGHPSGLPQKYAPGADVRNNAKTEFFTANLDTYGGNSGSPVFNEDTGDVEGILVRGDTDFVRVGSCWVSNVCPTTGCRGEDVTRTTQFSDTVPETPDEPVGDIETRLTRLEQTVVDIQEAIDEIRDQI